MQGGIKTVYNSTVKLNLDGWIRVVLKFSSRAGGHKMLMIWECGSWDYSGFVGHLSWPSGLRVVQQNLIVLVHFNHLFKKNQNSAICHWRGIKGNLEWLDCLGMSSIHSRWPLETKWLEYSASEQIALHFGRKLKSFQRNQSLKQQWKYVVHVGSFGGKNGLLSLPVWW